MDTGACPCSGTIHRLRRGSMACHESSPYLSAAFLWVAALALARFSITSAASTKLGSRVSGVRSTGLCWCRSDQPMAYSGTVISTVNHAWPQDPQTRLRTTSSGRWPLVTGVRLFLLPQIRQFIRHYGSNLLLKGGTIRTVDDPQGGNRGPTQNRGNGPAP